MTTIGSPEVIAIFANLFEAICNIPLVLSVIKKKEIELGVSFGILRLVSSILWIIYGIKAELFLATFSNYFSMIGSLVLIFYKSKPTRPKSRTEELKELIADNNSSDDYLPESVYMDKKRII